MATSIQHVIVADKFRGHPHHSLRAAVLDDSGQRVGDFVYVVAGTWCATRTELWSPVSFFKEPEPPRSYFLPHQGDELVIERDDNNPVALRWAYARDFHLPHRNPYQPPYPFRLVRLQGGEVEEVLWTLTTDAGVPTWEQIIDLSTCQPRTGDDEISRAYSEESGDRTDGLIFQVFVGRWYRVRDIRAPYAVVAQHAH